MKKLTILTLTGFLSAAMFFASAQTPAPQPQTGQGRGGAPHAWNDKDKNGICDHTGRKVGEGKGRMMAHSGRRGRGMAGCARAMGHGHGAGRQSTTPPAPSQQ